MALGLYKLGVVHCGQPLVFFAGREVKEFKEINEYMKVARQRESGRSNKRFREHKATATRPLPQTP
jgi:hypothetical protein